MVNSELYTQNKLKEDAEAFREMNKLKYGEKSPDREGEKKTLVNVEDASFSIDVGIPTEEWDGLPVPGIVFCQTSPQ